MQSEIKKIKKYKNFFSKLYQKDFTEKLQCRENNRILNYYDRKIDI